MINSDLLKKITQVPGAPGFEYKIRALIKSEIEAYVDEIKTDVFGNLVAYRKGTSNKKMMITAHMDEISFMVTHIDNEGFIRFHTLGGFDAKTLTAQRVILHGKKDIIGVMGTKPIHVLTPEEKGKAARIQDYFIDTGLGVDEVNDIISIGDPITRERGFIEMGDMVNSKSIDNRVSVYILIEALKALKDQELPVDLYSVFTAQEEVGIRGATSATMGINPDFGINLDVTLAYDLPGAGSHEKVTELGKGTAIKVMDAMTICDYRMVKYMKKIAQENEISHQIEVLTAGGTDTAGMQRYSQNGCIAGGISIPTRYLHQVIEMAHKKDIKDSIDLLKACLISIDSFDWDHA